MKVFPLVLKTIHLYPMRNSTSQSSPRRREFRQKTTGNTFPGIQVWLHSNEGDSSDLVINLATPPPTKSSNQKRPEQERVVRDQQNVCRDPSQITERESILIKMSLKVVRKFEMNSCCPLDQNALNLARIDLNKKDSSLVAFH